MKKIGLLILMFLITLNIVACSNINGGQVYEKELVYEEIEKEIIRFHVIANSDSEEDQNLKLKVRDAVVDFVYNGLENSTSLEESRKFILDNKSEIENIARKEIENYGYDYKIESMLSRENFPDKVYGELVFPQGEYEAYRILIGEGKGQNWWCVMFPPLCFVDGSKEAIDSSNMIEELEKNSDKDLKLENKKSSLKDKNKKIVFKSKLLESIKSFFE
jgi:stage II sporulation protein R